MAQIKAVIFDLDGTVCNTLQDLAECTNRALADYGLPGHTVEAYKKIVGNGVDTQMRRAIGVSKFPSSNYYKSPTTHSTNYYLKTANVVDHQKHLHNHIRSTRQK